MRNRIPPVLLCAVALAACAQKAPTQNTSLNTGLTGPPISCNRPADVVLSDQDVKVATVQIGEASIGGLDVANRMQLVKILSANDQTGLLVDYLICESEQRGELNSKDSPRVDYVTRMLSYLYATHPTAAQFADWLKQNPPPSHPLGKLDMPDFTREGGILHFDVHGVRETFRLLDGGEAPLHVWIADYPQNRLQFAPSPGPFNLDPGQVIQVEVAVLCCAVPTAPLIIVVQTDEPPTVSHIAIRFADPSALSASFHTMLQGFSSALSRGLGGSASTDPPHFLATTAFDSVHNLYPLLNERLAWDTAGSLLSGVNWPAAAVVAYERAGADSSNRALLDQARYLAGPGSRSEPLTSSVESTASIPDVRSLHYSTSNALINADPKAAVLVLGNLKQVPQFRWYSESLQGDLDLREAVSGTAVSDANLAATKLESAQAAFASCYTDSHAPICGLRNVELSEATGNHRKLLSAIATFGSVATDQVSSQWTSHTLAELSRPVPGFKAAKNPHENPLNSVPK